MQSRAVPHPRVGAADGTFLLKDRDHRVEGVREDGPVTDSRSSLHVIRCIYDEAWFESRDWPVRLERTLCPRDAEARLERTRGRHEMSESEVNSPSCEVNSLIRRLQFYECASALGATLCFRDAIAESSPRSTCHMRKALLSYEEGAAP